jgi:hypothetical protein
MATERSRFEGTITLGSVLNLVVLITAAVSCALYVANVDKLTAQNSLRIEALERRMDREQSEAVRRLERIEIKLDDLQSSVATLKAQRRE